MGAVTLAHAKTHLSQLFEQVEAGDEVVITRRGQPVARISPVAKPKHPVKLLSFDTSHGHTPAFTPS